MNNSKSSQLPPGHANPASTALDLREMATLAKLGAWSSLFSKAFASGDLSLSNGASHGIHGVLCSASAEAAHRSPNGAQQLARSWALILPAEIISHWANRSLLEHSAPRSSFGRFWQWESAIADLLEIGADPIASTAAAAAAREGNAFAISTMLSAGLDPNASTPGHMPLIFEALCKDRLHVSEDKMKCATLLWSKGARCSPVLSHAQPSSLLEWLLLGEPTLKGHPPLDELNFNWNYFDQFGSGPESTEALLPDPSDRAGIARLGRFFFSFGFPDAEHYPWLHQACLAAHALAESQFISELTPMPSAQKSSLERPKSL